MDTQLEVRIESEGGALALTPMGLLEHFLPGAKLMAGSARVFEGRTPGQPDRKVYVQTEALYGMLMEAREKHLNPISSMYLIPSSHPDQPAGHKIKYDVGVQRARRIPGFLGMNMGLLVRRDKKVQETAGELALAGDEVLGAWAEIYVAGLPRPLRKEVSKAEFYGTSAAWSKKGGFMLCKVAVDHLLRLNYPTLYADIGDVESTHDAALKTGEILEAGESSLNNGDEDEEKTPEVSKPVEFAPDQLYVGTLTRLSPRMERGQGKPDTAGVIEIDTAQGPLVCFFFTRPEVLRDAGLNWETLRGLPAAMSFTEKADKSGRVWRHVKDFKLAADEADEHELPEPGETGETGEEL